MEIYLGKIGKGLLEFVLGGRGCQCFNEAFVDGAYDVSEVGRLSWLERQACSLPAPRGSAEEC